MKIKERCNFHFHINGLIIGILKTSCQPFKFYSNYFARFVGCAGGSRVWGLRMEMAVCFVCRRVVDIVELIC